MLKPAWPYQPRQSRPSFPFITAVILGLLGIFISTGAVAPVLAGEEMASASNVFLLDHLVAYWNFDEDFDATIGGEAFDAEPSSAPPRIDGQSRFGDGSAYFIRTNGEYLDVDQKVITQGQDHSYSAWYYYTHEITGDERYFVLETRNASGDNGWSISYGLRHDGTEVVAQALTESSGGTTFGVGYEPATAGWHNVVVTYDFDNTGAEHTFYLDGVFQNTAETSPELMDTAGLVIGGHRGREGRNFHGWIDDVAIWDKVLTPEEVAAIQTRPILPPAPYPDLTMGVQATIPYEGGYGQGEAYCYFGEGHTTLTDPVIVVEGFDPKNSNTRDKLYNRLNTEDLLVTMQAEGFDAVVLNFDSGADYIQRNAMLLVELITRVRDQIPERKDIVVIGASMGGLVSRYALAYMEHNGMEHGVRTFISFDSPQKVANIPISIQFLLKWADDRGASGVAAKLDQLSQPAAKQMLGWRFDEPSYGGHQLRIDLFTELAAMGDYPSQLHKVAIANGSGTRANQGFPESSRLLQVNFGGGVVVDADCYALPGKDGETVFEAAIGSVAGYDAAWWEWTVPTTALHWDNAPGGFRDTAEEAEADYSFDWWIIHIPYGSITADQPNHCFIPTISALDLNISDPFFNIAETDSLTLLSMTPFDEVHFPTENQDHVSVTPENKIWFMDEIRRPDPVSGVDDLPDAVASRPLLREVFPNPFNPQTRIIFDLPRPAVASVKVYDVGGRLVATLADGAFRAGSHKLTWTGKDGGGRDVAAGVYFCRLVVGQDLQVRRMALIK